jgi:hypothetical protein
VSSELICVKVASAVVIELRYADISSSGIISAMAGRVAAIRASGAKRAVRRVMGLV